LISFGKAATIDLPPHTSRRKGIKKTRNTKRWYKLNPFLVAQNLKARTK